MELRVLLVEDSNSVLAVLHELFASLDKVRVVATAASEPQACEWLREHAAEWDLAVVDLVLEQGSGFGVIRAARQCSPRRPIVVLSAYATPEVREHCVRIGADAVFDKNDMHAFRDALLQLVRAEYGLGGDWPATEE